MRKKLTATICVFSGFLICVSMLISSVLAATTATATITASVTYTPAIQAKIWITDNDPESANFETTKKEFLIFNNADATGLAQGVTMTNGIISIPDLEDSESGTTFTITVQNFSKGIDGNNTTSDAMYFGLFVGGNTEISVTTKDPNTQATTTTKVPVTDGDFVTSEIVGSTGTYQPVQDGPTYATTLVEASGTASLQVTPTIVIPGTIEFDILLYGGA